MTSRKKTIYLIITIAALGLCVTIYARARNDAAFLRPTGDAPLLTGSKVGLPSDQNQLGSPAPSDIVATAPVMTQAQAASFSIRIPSISLNAPVEYVGLTATGDMATPARLADVGWYEYGTAPGAVGSAVFAGHVDDALGLPAVFAKLNQVQIGDDVYVTTKDGTTLHFVVTDSTVYNVANAPVKEIFHEASGERLIKLITCSGTIENGSLSYNDRLVVTAKEI